MKPSSLRELDLPVGSVVYHVNETGGWVYGEYMICENFNLLHVAREDGTPTASPTPFNHLRGWNDKIFTVKFIASMDLSNML